MCHSHLVGGMSRLGHAVTSLDGIIELLVHGQLWIRGAACWGAKTREEIHRLSGVGKNSGNPIPWNRRRHSSPGMGERALELGDVGSFMVLDGLQPSPDQRTREYQSRAASLMSLPKPLDTQMGRARDPERARDLPRSHSSGGT